MSLSFPKNAGKSAGADPIQNTVPDHIRNFDFGQYAGTPNDWNQGWFLCEQESCTEAAQNPPAGELGGTLKIYLISYLTRKLPKTFSLPLMKA